MLSRPPVHDGPDDHPDEAEDSAKHKGVSPAPHQGDPGYQRRRHRGANRGARIENSHRQGALAHRKPLRHRTHSAGKIRGLGRTEQHPKERELAGRASQGVQSAGDRPARNKNQEGAPRAQPIHQSAAHRVHHRVAEEKRERDVGILHRGDVHFILNGLREHRERLPVEIVQLGREAQHHHDIPAQPGDFFHGVENRRTRGERRRKGTPDAPRQVASPHASFVSAIVSRNPSVFPFSRKRRLASAANP